MLIKETKSVDNIVKEVERQNDSMMKQHSLYHEPWHGSSQLM